MKTISILLFLYLCTACVKYPNYRDTPTPIQQDAIETAWIVNGPDSILLSKTEINSFVTEWNQAQPEGWVKMQVKYKMVIALSKDSTRTFYINGRYIKEHGDWAYSIQDSTLFSAYTTP